MSDKLIFEIEGKAFGIATSDVWKILEVDRVSFLPGSSGFVSGVISLKGEPVVVVDAAGALLGTPRSERVEGPRRIVVARDKKACIGFDIGPIEVAFCWEEGAEEDAPPSGAHAFRPEEIIDVDWRKVYSKASRILSSSDRISA